MDKERETAILIIQIFENVLNERNNNILDEVCVSGTTYYELEDKITQLLKER